MNDSTGPPTEMPEGSCQPRDAADEYALATEQPSRAEDPPEPAPAANADAPTPNNGDRQFSLGELLGLVTVVAIILSVLSSIARWMKLGNSPASLAALFATGLGFFALLSMVLLVLFPNVRRIIVVGWWILLGAYIVTSVAAVVMAK